MNFLKQIIKTCLVWVAGSIGWHFATNKPGRLIILMYHRVLPADDHRTRFEEPGMIVTPDTFALHLATLQQSNLEIVDLTDWVKNRDNYAQRTCVAITFDDGWRDNFEFAFPLLQEKRIPATIFAVEEHIGKCVQFWPNRVAKLLLSDHRNEAFLDILQQQLGRLPNEFNRESVSALIQGLKKFNDEQIYSWLASIDDTGDSPREMMNEEEFEQSLNKANIALGSHTLSHCRLNDFTEDSVLHNEVVMSKKRLEARFGKEIELFCFPNGDCSASALNLVAQHYKAAVTTKRGHVDEFTPHELKRIGVHNDISDTKIKFKARMSGWV